MNGHGSPLHSFVDESLRTVRDAEVYLLAAAVCSEGDCPRVRDSLRALLDQRQKRLHWRDESEPRRRAIAGVIGSIAIESVVVIGAPVDPARQERARRLCMETLYPLLSDMGVERVFQERRNDSLNRADLRMVDALRSRRAIPSALRVEFAQPMDEPMLWIPDAVAGAVGQARAGSSNSLTLMAATVKEIDIPLR